MVLRNGYSRRLGRRLGVATGSLVASAAALLLLASTASAFTFTSTEGVAFSNLEIGTVNLSCEPINMGEMFDCSVLPTSVGLVTINWGDGTAIDDTGTATQQSCNTGSGFCIYDVEGSHTYAEEGGYMVSFSAPNTFGQGNNKTAKGNSTATVADAPLIDGSGAIGLSTTEGTLGSFSLGSFVDTNPAGSASDLTATIGWGDGTAATAGTVAAGTTGFDVSGSHVFAHAGTRIVTVTVDDVGGSTTEFSTHITVHDAPLTATAATGLTATEGLAPTFRLATFTDANPDGAAGDFSATVAWGDGTQGAATIAADPRGGFDVSATHTYAEEGTRRATVTIHDIGGSTAVAKPVIVVGDAPLTIEPVGLAGAAGHALSGSVASFTDANPGGSRKDYSASINWGDGTASTAGSIAASGSGGFTIAGAHTYARAGKFTATVTVKDVGGATASTNDDVAIAPAVQSFVTATMRWGFSVTTKFTKVIALVVHGAPRGGEVIVKCHGHGCPYRAHTLQVRKGKKKGATVNLAGPFHNRRLRPGTRFSVEILSSGSAGKLFTFKIRSGRAPKISMS